ncbi:MAG: DUF2029 domain-containing protein [Candidatus Kerfeldbacteria bacterium]|nr:DUF2029 domain-containing protein [Candidatus Kerfeldbacteria bacterium]
MRIRLITWGVLVIVSCCAMVVLWAPDFIQVPFGSEGAKARLIRDDHELDIFYQRGSWVTRGITPYDASIFQEYPQAGLAYITLPYLFGNEYETYRWVLVVMNTVTLVSLVVISLRLLKKLNRSPWYIFLLLLPSMLYFGLSRFDVLVALAVQIGLLLILSHRWRWAAILFAVAFLIKWYPIIFLPLLYAYIKQTEGERASRVIREFYLIGVSIVASVLVASFVVDGFVSLRPYLFHGARAGGVGSLYFMLLQGPLLSTGIPPLNYLGLTVFLLLQVSLPLYALVQWRVVAQWLITPRQLILWMSLATVLFTLFSRFYSPQWIVWFVPLLLLVADKRLAGLIIGYDILNYVSFPLIWQVWGPFSTGYLCISLVIIVCLVLIVRRVFLLILDKKELAPSE